MGSPHMSPDPPLLELIAADIDCYSKGSAEFQNRSASLIRRISILLTPSLMCCLLIRLAHAAHLHGWRWVASSLSRLNALAHKIEVDPAASVGPGLYIPHPTAIILRGCAGRGLTLYASAIVGPVLALPNCGDTLAECPVLGDNVTVGAFAIIVGPITVGDGAQIGPGVVVAAPVLARSRLVAAGSLGRVVRG